MRVFGFSTGALARGDYRRGLEMLRPTQANAVELSALRERELVGLMSALDSLDLRQFEYVSIHAPSRLVNLTEAAVADALLPCATRGWNVVLHPDVIRDANCWRQFGPQLCLENMDKRKATGRTPEELMEFAEQLPEARICLDLAHARQVDSTFAVARFIIGRFRPDRIAQLHLSELDSRSHHASLSTPMISAVQKIAHWIPDVPVILESGVSPSEIEEELRLARLCFGPPPAEDPTYWPVREGAVQGA